MENNQTSMPIDCNSVIPKYGSGDEKGFRKENSITLEAIRLDGITSPINKNNERADKKKKIFWFLINSIGTEKFFIFLLRYRQIKGRNNSKIITPERATLLIINPV